MTFTNEMIEKAKKAASAEELLEMAKAEGVELSASDAEMYYNFINGSELTDEELSQVAGGKNDEDNIPDPKFQAGQTFRLFYNNDWKTCRIESYYYSGTYYHYMVQLSGCSGFSHFREDYLVENSQLI